MIRGPAQDLVIDENPIRRAILETGLKDAGFDNITLLGDTTGLLDRIYRSTPTSHHRPGEPQPRRAGADVPGLAHRAPPIAMFVDQSDRATIAAAMEAGVSAYIVDGLKRERVAPSST